MKTNYTKNFWVHGKKPTKRDSLTLWIFLSLKEGPKYVSGLQESIERFSKGTIRAEEQSLYRTLRKFYHLKMVDFSAGKRP